MTFAEAHPWELLHNGFTTGRRFSNAPIAAKTVLLEQRNELDRVSIRHAALGELDISLCRGLQDMPTARAGIVHPQYADWLYRRGVAVGLEQ